MSATKMPFLDKYRPFLKPKKDLSAEIVGMKCKIKGLELFRGDPFQTVFIIVGIHNDNECIISLPGHPELNWIVILNFGLSTLKD